MADLQRTDKDSDFLFKDTYFEDREFLYEPSFLEQQLSEPRPTDWPLGGKKTCVAYFGEMC